MGVGSSSAFTVGLLNALYALKGEMTTKRQLAEEAIHVEQNMIKENVGSQDQIATAFGGFNKITFDNDQGFTLQPVAMDHDRFKLLQDHMMLFFTGFSRTASNVAGEQIKKTPEREKELKRMCEMVDEAAVSYTHLRAHET